MSLLLNGSKTLTIAGTELQCVEIYTGEAYTMPIEFKTTGGIAINCAGWSLSMSAQFYRCDIEYPTTKTAKVSNLTKLTAQPSTGNGTYSQFLTAAYSDAANGLAYIYIPAQLTNGSGSPVATPVPDLTDTDSILVIVTMTITRTGTSGQPDISREPIGFIVRYQ
jgi:hypothetical protein